MVYPAGTDAALTFNDSIARGFPLAYERLINGAGGTADLTLDNSDVPVAGENLERELPSSKTTSKRTRCSSTSPAATITSASALRRSTAATPATRSARRSPTWTASPVPIDGNGDGTRDARHGRLRVRAPRTDREPLRAERALEGCSARAAEPSPPPPAIPTRATRSA